MWSKIYNNTISHQNYIILDMAQTSPSLLDRSPNLPGKKVIFEFFCAFKFGFSPNFHKIQNSFDLKVPSTVYIAAFFAWSSSSPTPLVYPHVRVCIILSQVTPMLWYGEWDWLVRGTAIKGDILHILNSTEVDISTICIIRR